MSFFDLRAGLVLAVLGAAPFGVGVGAGVEVPDSIAEVLDCSTSEVLT